VLEATLFGLPMLKVNMPADRIPTLPFNGYADQVASLYAGMDLRKFF